MEIEWTMERTLQLIEQVAMRPSIWKFTPKDYKNRIVIQKRKDALEEVANFFQTTPKRVEHKLSILRTQYSREKIKMIKSRKSAVNEEDVYESRWFAFKPMSFMMMQKRREYKYGEDLDDNLLGDDTMTNDTSSFNDFKIMHVESLANDENQSTIDGDETSEPPAKKKKEEMNYDNDSFLPEPSSSPMVQIFKSPLPPPHTPSTNNNYEKDEFVIFGESISLQLRNLKTKYGKSLAKLNIQKAIFDAELWEEKNCLTNGLRQARSDARLSEENNAFSNVM